MDDHTPDTPLKQCAHCKQWLPATSDFFHKQRKSKDGLRPQCRQCRSVLAKLDRALNVDAYERKGARESEKYRNDPEYRQRRHEQYLRRTPHVNRKAVFTQAGKRFCRECELWLPKTPEFFHFFPSGPVSTLCNECRAKHKRYTPPEGMKHCAQCNQDFSATEEYFYRSSRTESGLSAYCKTCNNKYGRKSRAKRPEKNRQYEQSRKAHRREYRFANPGKMRAIKQRRRARERQMPDHFTKDPVEWLNWRFGPRKAKQILARIVQYFEWVRQQDGDH